MASNYIQQPRDGVSDQHRKCDIKFILNLVKAFHTVHVESTITKAVEQLANNNEASRSEYLNSRVSICKRGNIYVCEVHVFISSNRGEVPVLLVVFV